MMIRLAWRSLVTRPVRAAVLVAGFGFGIAVMVELLGVGAVILEQAHAPALSGGGDVVVYGPFGPVPGARLVMSVLRRAPDIGPRVAAVSAVRRARLHLMTPDGSIPIAASGGVPSLEKSIGDPEVSTIAAWSDAPGDRAWARPEPGDVLRALDRFHGIPDARGGASSWAEWLYFNGRTPDGRLRLYLTFLVGPPSAVPGARKAAVRLQLERDGGSGTYSASGDVDEATVLANAPDLEIAGNRVRLDGSSYRMTLRLTGDAAVSGEIVLDAAEYRSLPPATIRGAGGWMSGYVVPALAGTMRGALRIGGESLEFDRAAGYHDHNWGFWEGVRWQWGQVVHDGLSILYGRVFPPADVADAARIPGFLAVVGPDGPIGVSTRVTIDDANDRVEVRARGERLDLALSFEADDTLRTALAGTQLPVGGSMDFLQMGGTYRATGTVQGRRVDFTARGSAETFKPR